MTFRHLAIAVAVALVSVPALAQFASDHDRREAFEHYRNGQELLSAEQFEKAAEEFQRAIAKDRLLTLAHYGLGQAYMALRRYTSAILAFTGCREAFQKLHDLRLHNRLAVERQRDDEIRELKDSVRRLLAADDRMNRLKAERLEMRIQDLERQRTINTGGFVPPPELSLALGSAYFRNGGLEEAEREWKAAVEVNSRMGEAHNNLAVLYMMHGRRTDAEAAIKAAERAGFRVNPNLKADIRKMTPD
jgi:Flp pilus assembly protein TadD